MRSRTVELVLPDLSGDPSRKFDLTLPISQIQLLKFAPGWR